METLGGNGKWEGVAGQGRGWGRTACLPLSTTPDQVGGQITHNLETQCQVSVMARGFLSLLATQPGASYPGNLEI